MRQAARLGDVWNPSEAKADCCMKFVQNRGFKGLVALAQSAIAGSFLRETLMMHANLH